MASLIEEEDNLVASPLSPPPPRLLLLLFLLLLLAAAEDGEGPLSLLLERASFNFAIASSETYCRSFHRPMRSSSLRICFGHLSYAAADANSAGRKGSHVRRRSLWLWCRASLARYRMCRRRRFELGRVAPVPWSTCALDKATRYFPRAVARPLDRAMLFVM